MEKVFKNIMNWLFGSQTKENTDQSKQGKDEIPKVVKPDLEVEVVKLSKDESKPRVTDSEQDKSIDDILTLSENVKPTETKAILNSTKSKTELERNVEEALTDSQKDKPYKNIKEEVENILRPLPKSEGFITRDHLVINELRMPYLECEKCGSVASIDKEDVECGKCGNQGILIKESEAV